VSEVELERQEGLIRIDRRLFDPRLVGGGARVTEHRERSKQNRGLKDVRVTRTCAPVGRCWVVCWSVYGAGEENTLTAKRTNQKALRSCARRHTFERQPTQRAEERRITRTTQGHGSGHISFLLMASIRSERIRNYNFPPRAEVDRHKRVVRNLGTLRIG